MQIVTWNVNGIRACQSKGLVEYMLKVDADIYCFQETKAHPDQLEDDLRNISPWHSYWSAASRKGYSGVALYSKTVPRRVGKGLDIRKFDQEGRILIADYGEFLLYNIYFPNGGSGPERHGFKQEFLERLFTHLLRQMASGREIIVVGDYNVAYLDIDVFDPIKLANESGFLPEERAWFKKFLAAGFVDGYRHIYPEEKNKFTWWSMRERARLGNRGWRIDHICLSSGLKRRLRAVEIQDAVSGSDHCPVRIELDFK